MKYLIGLIVFVLVVVYGAYEIWNEQQAAPVPTTFAECVEMGGLLMESYPEQCRLGDLTFVNPDQKVPPILEGDSPETDAPETSACRPSGCSGQVCTDEEVVTTCEFRPEYACYRTAVCERQPSGQCGWTPTPALTACLANPPQE